MLMIEKHDLFMELVEILEDTYEELESDFYLSEENRTQYATFSLDGLLPLFLYDKQKYLDKFCQSELTPGTFIKVTYQQKEIKGAVRIYLEHNTQNSFDYQKTLKFLSLLIVMDARLKYVPQQKIDLNPYYENFAEYLKNTNFIKTS